MNCRFLPITLPLALFISGCFFLPENLKTLKNVGDSQKEINSYLSRQVKLFNRLLADLKRNALRPGISKERFIRIYGDPVISKEIAGPSGNTMLLYRHPTNYFKSDRVYLYFDREEKLLRWEYKPYAAGS